MFPPVTERHGRQLQARLLGRFELRLDGTRIGPEAFERPSGLRLLKLILATAGHRVRREAAAELLWPEMEAERSAANLRKAVHFARRALSRVEPGDELIMGGGDSFAFAPWLELDVDVDALRAAIGMLERTEGPDSGVRTKRADDDATFDVLLRFAGSELLPEDAYEEWLVPLRERLSAQTLRALLVAAQVARSADDPETALALLDRALTLDPADEGTHRLAIEIHLQDGRLHAARRQLRSAEQAVAEAYGVAASPELGQLIELAAASRAVVRLDERQELPILGRRRELELAEAMLDRVAAGRIGAVLLRGGPGMGKTRILRELVRATDASRWSVVEIRGIESGERTPFAGIGSPLRRALEAVGNATWTEPGLSAVLTAAPGSERPTIDFASDEALAAGLVGALGQLVERRGPTVLDIDDVQWLDQQSIDVLVAIVHGLADHPLLVLLSMREEGPPPAQLAGLLDSLSEIGACDISVGPLAPRELRALLDREAAQPVDDRLADWAFEQSRGAPLFALELFRTARDGGATREHGSQTSLVRDAPIPTPPSVTRAVATRTAGLGETVRRLLAVAAEIGDESSFPELAVTVGAQPDDVLDALDAALGAGLLVELGGRYRFAHPLYRSAARASLSSRDRSELHLRIARHLATDVDPANRSAVDALLAAGVDVIALARHAAIAAELGIGEAVGLAVGLGFVGGEHLGRLFDARGAAAMLQTALTLWHRLPVEERALFAASRAYVARGWALHALGDEHSAATAFRGALEVARVDADRAAAAIGAAWIPYQHGRFDAAEVILRETLTSVSDRAARASIESELGWIAGRRGDWNEAYRMLEGAVAEFESAEPSQGLARALDRLGVAATNIAGTDDALPLLDRAVVLAVESADSRLEASIRTHRASTLRRAGKLPEARAEAGRAIEMTTLAGDLYMESVCHWTAAEIEHALGDYQEAIAERRRELEVLRRMGGNPQNEALAHAHIAFLAQMGGDAAESAAEASAARGIARRSGAAELVTRVDDALAVDAWLTSL